MVSLVMLVIIAACAALLYLKGTFAQGLTMVFNAILAGFIASAFFELLATVLIKQAPSMAPWAHMICFLLLFILAIAVLQTVAMQLSKQKIDLGLWPERIGRIISGILLGYIITGQLLTALAMGPLPSKYPYARFSERNIDPSKPNKALLNPDGFVTGLFSTISKGSFAPIGEPKSFAVLHADYLDQLYLNRHGVSDDIPVMTSAPALALPTKAGVWEAPSDLRVDEDQSLPSRPGEKLMLVRVGIRKSAIKDAGKFTLSQLRLICTEKGAKQGALAGIGKTVYPVGYIGDARRLELKPLTSKINISAADIPDKAKEIDFAFFVPTNRVPKLLGFKLNNIEKVSAPVSSDEEVPAVIPFKGSSEDAGDSEQQTSSNDQTSNSRSPSNDHSQGRGLSDVSRSVVGDLDQ